MEKGEYMLVMENGQVAVFSNELNIGRIFQASGEMRELDLNEDKDIIEHIIKEGKLKPLA